MDLSHRARGCVSSVRVAPAGAQSGATPALSSCCAPTRQRPERSLWENGSLHRTRIQGSPRDVSTARPSSTQTARSPSIAWSATMIERDPTHHPHPPPPLPSRRSFLIGWTSGTSDRAPWTETKLGQPLRSAPFPKALLQSREPRPCIAPDVHDVLRGGCHRLERFREQSCLSQERRFDVIIVVRFARAPARCMSLEPLHGSARRLVCGHHIHAQFPERISSTVGGRSAEH